MYSFYVFLSLIVTTNCIKCYSNVDSIRGITDCSTGWCKNYVGGSGKLEQSCDLTGDCRTCGYDPYSNEIKYCVGNSGRRSCCCNTDLCNGITIHKYTFWLILPFISKLL